MSLSAPFIHRPVATVFLTAAIALAGAVAFTVAAGIAAAADRLPHHYGGSGFAGSKSRDHGFLSRDTAGTAVRPYRRRDGNDFDEFSRRDCVTLQFDLNRNIDAAARDVQAAINAARGYLPTDLPNNPTYRKVNPADAPIHDCGADLGRLRSRPPL